jgi:ketosteroid isomerase-like protein
MGWAYRRTDLTLTRKTGEKVEALLWAVYVLEKRGGQWKIVLLDWSLHVPRLGAKGTP